MVQYTNSFKYKAATYLGCITSGPVFVTPLENQQVFLDQLPATYTFVEAQSCSGASLTLTSAYSVDKYVSPPSWMSVVWNAGTGGTFTFSPSSVDAGVYTVRITYTDTSQSTSTTSTFLVDVVPYPSYTANTPTSTCGSDIWPMILGRQTDTYYQYGDVDSTGTNYIACGITKLSTISITTQDTVFLQNYNELFNLNYHVNYEIHSYSANSRHCYFGDTGYIYMGIISKLSQSSYEESFSILKITSSTGQIQNAKSISTSGYYTIMTSFKVDTSTGNIYIIGASQKNDLRSQNSYQESFIMMYDTTLTPQYFKSLFHNTNGNTMNYVILSGTYLHITTFNYDTAWRTGVMTVNAADGSHVWNKALVYSYTSALIAKTQLETDSTYLYAAIGQSETGPTTSGYEVIIPKFTASSGALQGQLELKLSATPTDLSLTYDSTTSSIFVCMAFTTSFELIRIDQSTFTIQLTRLYFSYSTQYNSPSLKMVNGVLFLMIQAWTTTSYMFWHRVLDITNMNWNGGCTALQSRDTSITFAYYNTASNGINGALSSYWTTQTITVTTISLSQTLSNFYSNPTYFKGSYYTASVADFKTYYSSCYTISSPGNPTINDYIGQTGSYQGFVVSSYPQNITLPIFTQCQDYTFTISATLSDGSALPSYIVFYSTDLHLEVSPTSNAYVGTYTIRYTATNNVQNTLSNYTDFQLEIITNYPPYLINDYSLTNQMYAWHNWTCTYSFGYDSEGDQGYLDGVLYYYNLTLVSPQPSWFIVDNSSVSDAIIVTLEQPIQPAGSYEMYYIDIMIWDQFNTATPRNNYIEMNLTYNKAPYMISPAISMTITPTTIPWPYNYTFWYSDFTDDEGDSFLIDCSSKLTTASVGITSFMLTTQNLATGNVTLYGTPPSDNNYAGTYTYTCFPYDPYDGTLNYYPFSVVVNAKQVVTISGNPGSQSTRLPNSLIIDTSSYTSDPEVQAYTKTLYINGTVYSAGTFGSWFQWDSTTQIIGITPNDNSQGGNHTVSIKYDNGIAVAQYMAFNIEVIQDWPLVAMKQIDNINAIVNNIFQFDYNQTELFSNPENEAYTMYFRQAGSNVLPYFISQNYSNGTFVGFATEGDVGTYDLECVGVDDAFWETAISFTITIKPCYYKCLYCWDSQYNTCKQCKPGYFLFNNECMDNCPDGTYADTSTWSCLTCPSRCSLCTGSNEYTQCQKCKNPNFYLSNGCYQSCPKGYWGDVQTYYCKVCHPACTACTGPYSTQCQECLQIYGYNALSAKVQTGYMLVGTECKLPKCAEGQFFNWTAANTGNCIDCNSRCKTCVGPTANECVTCYPGYVYGSQMNNCTGCAELWPTGTQYANEEYECADKCGDGVVVSSKCDDGNMKSGDGCSSNCIVEYGYECLVPGQPCRENIAPTFSVVSITESNLIYIQFSEPIHVASATTLSSLNINVEISGDSSEYIFSWRMIEDPRNQLLPDRNITKFQVKLYDLESSLTGTENIKISFNDYSQIQDIAGNTLVNNSYAQINPYPFIYVSTSEASAASNGGSSLKYTVMSVFSFNIGLKIIMNGSMQYLWGLVHALQVFNYLLYLNIDFPPNVSTFSGYLGVASGDIQELNQFIPDLSEYIINRDNVVEQADNDTLATKFADNGVSPYFIVGYGQKLTIWCVLYLIILPTTLVMHKLCRKVKFWEELIGSFFFNLPLRTLIEMYIEITLQVIINTQFIKFSNWSQFITTCLALIFGTIALLMPFITMTLIYHNRRHLRKYKWRKSFGMLTDELSKKSITQLYYYPIFMYQRLVICAIIVYLQSYPLVQCISVIACNIGMIGYLIIVKPFKEENQQTTTVIDEIVIMVCVCFFIALYVQDLTIDGKKNLGWGIIILILFSVCKNFSVVIFFGYQQMRKRMQEMFAAEDEQKDSPHTSDGWNSDTIEDVKTEEVEMDLQQIKLQEEYDKRINQQQASRQGMMNMSPSNFNNFENTNAFESSYQFNPLNLMINPENRQSSNYKNQNGFN